MGIQLVASNPMDMAAAQKELVAHVNKVYQSKCVEASDLKKNMDIAKKNGWDIKNFKRSYNVALNTAIYYQKIKKAVESGYYIVPNMPLDIFAIRTDKAKPVNKTIPIWHDASQKARLLPEGEGGYVSDQPKGTTWDDDEGRKKFDIETFTEVLFPVSLVKPEVMESTAKAMALNLFDQVGIAPQVRGGDPMIIGQVLKPNTTDFSIHGNKKAVSFLISWFLDVDEL